MDVSEIGTFLDLQDANGYTAFEVIVPMTCDADVQYHEAFLTECQKRGWSIVSRVTMALGEQYKMMRQPPILEIQWPMPPSIQTDPSLHELTDIGDKLMKKWQDADALAVQEYVVKRVADRLTANIDAASRQQFAMPNERLQAMVTEGMHQLLYEVMGIRMKPELDGVEDGTYEMGDKLVAIRNGRVINVQAIPHSSAKPQFPFSSTGPVRYDPAVSKNIQIHCGTGEAGTMLAGFAVSEDGQSVTITHEPADLEAKVGDLRKKFPEAPSDLAPGVEFVIRNPDSSLVLAAMYFQAAKAFAKNPKRVRSFLTPFAEEAFADKVFRTTDEESGFEPMSPFRTQSTEGTDGTA